MIELERGRGAPISRLNDCLVVDDNNEIFLLPGYLRTLSYSPRSEEEEERETVHTSSAIIPRGIFEMGNISNRIDRDSIVRFFRSILAREDTRDR